MEVEEDLNNEKPKENFSKSDTENEDRIQNDISDAPKEKNTNIVKERRRKKNSETARSGRSKSSKGERKKSIETAMKKDEQQETDKNVNTPDEEQVVGVFVHEAEPLEMDFLVCHPVVKVFYILFSISNVELLQVSLVEGGTGDLLGKTDPGR